MSAAAAAGECVVILDMTTRDGFRLQWFARQEGDRIRCQAWHQPPGGRWMRGASMRVVGRSLDGLRDLMLAQAPAAAAPCPPTIRSPAR